MNAQVPPRFKHKDRSAYLSTLACLASLTFSFLPHPARATIYTWDGGGSTDLWSDGFNWLANVGPPSSPNTELIFTGNTRLTPVQNSNFTLSSLEFDANAGAFVLGGTGTLTLQTIFQLSAANQTINNKIALSGTAAVYAQGSGTLTLNGVLSGGTASLAKQGGGMLILTANNTYTGGTSIIAGTLSLDFSNAIGAAASNIIAGGSALTMNGSTLALKGSNVAGTNTSQTFSGLTIFAGAQTISLTAGSGGTTTLNLGSITRNIGGTMNFVSSANSTVTTSATNTNGILGGYAIYGGNDWATISGGQVASYTAYTNNTWAAGNNTTVTASGSVAANSTTNSLRFGAPGAFTLNLSGTNTIASGGLLVSSAVGNNLTQINGGSLTGANSADLIVYQSNTANGLTIGSSIVNNGGATSLTKSGPGLLTLTGASTFTGLLRVYEGTLTFAAGSSWSNPAASGILQAAVVRGGATLNINGSINLTNQEMDISTTVSSPAIVNLNSGGLLTTATTAIGYAGTGIFNQTSGTHNTGFIRMSAAYTNGGQTVSNGTYNMSGGTLTTSLAIVGDQAPAAFNHTGGTVTTNGLQVSAGASYNLSGASSTFTATNVRLGGLNGVGTFNQSAGSLTINGNPADYAGYLSVGDANGGIYNLSGGTLSTAETDLGYEGTGVINQTSGTHTIVNAGTLFIAYSAGNSGTYNLNGGTLQLGNIMGLDGTSTFNFNGGTLKAAADQANWISGLTSANVRPGGAKIDNNGFNLTIAQPLLHSSIAGDPATDGGLRKDGLGTLTLTGANTYVGETNVAGGKLANLGAIAGAVLVSSGATLTGTGTIAGPLNVNAGGLVTLASGTMTVGGGVTNNGLMRFSRGATLSIGSGGPLINNGTLDVISGSFSAAAGFTNNGILLDANVVRAKSLQLNRSVNPPVATVTIESYTGHTYQLQRSASLGSAANFQNVGDPQEGSTGMTLSFADPNAIGSQGFYRITVDS